MAASTSSTARRELLRFADFAGNCDVGELAARPVIDHWLEQPGLAASTRRKLLSRLRDFCGWLVREGHLAADPTVNAGRIREPRALPRALSDEQVVRVLAACTDERVRLIVGLELDLGLRSVEVAGLRVEDINQAERTMLVTGKGGHQRRLPVPDALWLLLADQIGGRTAGPVIRSRQHPDRPVGAAHVRHLLRPVFTAAGVADSGHALRHTFAGRLVRSGVDLAVVRQLLGHSNVATTSRYLDFEDPARLRAAISRPAGLPSPDPTVSVLVDVVADLAASVAELRRRIDHQPSQPVAAMTSTTAAERGPPGVSCRVCGQVVLGDTRHCPDCAGHYRNLGPHRRAAHGATRRHLPAGCGHSARPHEHTTAETCVCPDCGQELRYVASEHLAATHMPCPDCDRAFINLAAHRRQAHLWAAAGPSS